MAQSKEFKFGVKFTETYKKYQNVHSAIREAKCLQVQYPDMLTEIEEGDLFAGRISPPYIGVTPDEWGQTAFGYFLLEDEFEKALECEDLSSEGRRYFEEIYEFWQKENTSSRLRKAYSDKMEKELYSDDWMNASGVSFPLYRITGGNINFKKLMKLGIPGLHKEVKKYKNEAAEKGKDKKFYEALEIILDLFTEVCLSYAEQAREMSNYTENSDRKAELQIMADILEKITRRKPETFRESLQLFWLYSLVADVRNYGRMDIYIGDFYVNDLNRGVLTEKRHCDCYNLCGN